VGRVEKDGHSELVFKGMETVRSDWTDIAKLFQKELVETLFNGGNLEGVAQKYTNLILAGEVDHLLVYKKRLGKPLEQYVKNVPPHVRAAKENRDRNSLGFRKGSIINYCITVSGPTLYSSNKDKTFDYENYIDKQINPILKMFLPLYDDGIFNTKQQSLFNI
jgi:DNA polymerase-2